MYFYWPFPNWTPATLAAHKVIFSPYRVNLWRKLLWMCARETNLESSLKLIFTSKDVPCMTDGQASFSSLSSLRFSLKSGQKLARRIVIDLHKDVWTADEVRKKYADTIYFEFDAGTKKLHAFKCLFAYLTALVFIMCFFRFLFSFCSYNYDELTIN